MEQNSLEQHKSMRIDHFCFGYDFFCFLVIVFRFECIDGVHNGSTGIGQAPLETLVVRIRSLECLLHHMWWHHSGLTHSSRIVIHVKVLPAQQGRTDGQHSDA